MGQKPEISPAGALASYDAGGPAQSTEGREEQLLAISRGILGGQKSGLCIPRHDESTIAYHGNTENISTITYKLNSDAVAVLTFEYDGDGGATDGDRITGYLLS